MYGFSYFLGLFQDVSGDYGKPWSRFFKGLWVLRSFLLFRVEDVFLGQATPTTQWWSNRCTTDYRVFLDWPTQQQHVSCIVFHCVKGWKKIIYIYIHICFFGSIPKITLTVILETSSSSSLWRMGAPSFLEFFLGNMGVQWWFIYVCLKKRIPAFQGPEMGDFLFESTFWSDFNFKKKTGFECSTSCQSNMGIRSSFTRGKN